MTLWPTSELPWALMNYDVVNQYQILHITETSHGTWTWGGFVSRKEFRTWTFFIQLHYHGWTLLVSPGVFQNVRCQRIVIESQLDLGILDDLPYKIVVDTIEGVGHIAFDQAIYQGWILPFGPKILDTLAEVVLSNIGFGSTTIWQSYWSCWRFSPKNTMCCLPSFFFQWDRPSQVDNPYDFVSDGQKVPLRGSWLSLRGSIDGWQSTMFYIFLKGV